MLLLVLMATEHLVKETKLRVDRAQEAEEQEGNELESPHVGGVVSQALAKDRERDTRKWDT